MTKIQLRNLVQARSGDKGNTVNIAIFAPNKQLYDTLLLEVTPQRVKEHFSGLVKGEVIRYTLPNLYAMNFVCKDALDGGGSATMRLDNLGKCFASNLLRMEVEMNDSVNLPKS